MGWLVGWLAGWLVGWLVGWLDGWGYSSDDGGGGSEGCSSSRIVVPVVGCNNSSCSSSSSRSSSKSQLFVWQVPLLSWLVSPGGRLIGVADYNPLALRNFLRRNAYDFSAQLVRPFVREQVSETLVVIRPSKATLSSCLLSTFDYSSQDFLTKKEEEGELIGGKVKAGVEGEGEEEEAEEEAEEEEWYS
ncbi:hypothetical protein M0802_003032 [Mischocyttarus mexicanus]|nr:hypothetical protein M0802_003032 [Mischocyttarus mexicanus]